MFTCADVARSSRPSSTYQYDQGGHLTQDQHTIGTRSYIGSSNVLLADGVTYQAFSGYLSYSNVTGITNAASGAGTAKNETYR